MNHGGAEPSDWLRRWVHLVRPQGSVLDLACGSGRHLRWLAAKGFAMTGVDRDAGALAPLRSLGDIIEADLENSAWPLANRRFDAVVVTNYLWRPLWPSVLASLAPGGVLIYETFADGQQTVGRPSRPDFLLRHGELLEVCSALRIIAYEDGYLDTPQRFVQRVVAAAQETPDPALRFPLLAPQAQEHKDGPKSAS